MQVDVGGLGFGAGPQHDPPAAVGDEGHRRAEVDGHGEGEALVVVGVVADEVDPARAVGATTGVTGRGRAVFGHGGDSMTRPV